MNFSRCSHASDLGLNNHVARNRRDFLQMTGAIAANAVLFSGGCGTFQPDTDVKKRFLTEQEIRTRWSR
jgi:hypothetical protein